MAEAGTARSSTVVSGVAHQVLGWLSHPNRHRLVRRYALIWAMLPLYAVLAAGAFYGYRAYRDAAADLVVERDRQVAFLSAARLEDELSKFSDELQSLARDQDMISQSPSRQRRALESDELRLSVFDGGIVVLDAFGRVQAAQPERPEHEGADWSDRSYFRELLSSPSPRYTDTASDGPDGGPAVVVAVPVLGPSSEFRGAVVGMFRLGDSTLNPFYASIVRLRIGQSGQSYVVGSRGQVLYDSSGRLVGRSFADRGLPDVDLTASGTAVRTTDQNGDEVVAAFVQIPGTPWTLVTEDNWAALTETTRGYVRGFFLIMALALVIPPVGAGLVLRTYSQSLGASDRFIQESRLVQMAQADLLPKHTPVMPGWRVSHKLVADQDGRCASYDWHFLDDGVLAVSVGEVAEKSMAAIPVLASLRATLRGAARQGMPAATALGSSNELLAPDRPDHMGVTCLHARVDPISGRVSLASAGHATPFAHTQAAGFQAVDVTGVHLGEDPSAVFTTQELTLEPGDCLILGSESLLGAKNPGGLAFGATRLPKITAAVGSDGREIVEAVFADLQDFTGKDWQPDADLVIVVIERLARDETSGIGA